VVSPFWTWTENEQLARMQRLFDEQERRHQAEILTWTTQLREAEQMATQAAQDAPRRRDQCVAAVEAAQHAASQASKTLQRIGITTELPRSSSSSGGGGGGGASETMSEAAAKEAEAQRERSAAALKVALQAKLASQDQRHQVELVEAVMEMQQAQSAAMAAVVTLERQLEHQQDLPSHEVEALQQQHKRQLRAMQVSMKTL
jgi:hypothetical protein